ncbi:MAG: DUF3000 family protein [Cryobacterium sp.]
MLETEEQFPAEFTAALASLRRAASRPDVTVAEITAPRGLAPFAAAFSADIKPTGHGSDSDRGTGRFVLLYDPTEPEAWGGAFRVVSFAHAPLETEIGLDPFLADVTWTWLIGALETRGAAHTAASGTATTTLSSGFGALAGATNGATLELRASWTPLDHNLTAHVEGWVELLCMLAGLPPAGEGISMFSARRAARG